MSTPRNHKRHALHATPSVKHKPASGREPLFRQRVLTERRSQWLGTVLLAPTISHTVFVVFATVSASAVLSLLFFGEFSRSEQVSGWLVPDQGLVRVVAPQSGVITRLHVRDGDAVAAGDALITVSTELQSEAFGATQIEIVRRLRSRRDSLMAEREVHRKLLEEEIDGLSNRISALSSEQDHLAHEISIQRGQIRLASQAVERLRGILERGLATAQQVDDAESKRLDYALKLSELERQLAATGRQRLELEAQHSSLPLKASAQAAEHERKLAELEQELLAAEARRQFVITATQAGIVTALRGKEGSSANTSLPLLTIIPAGSELEAQLFLPSKAVGFIRTGQEVRIRYEAFPYQKFGHHQGSVTSISRSAINPTELGKPLVGLTSLLRGDEPVYLVTVKLMNQSVIAYGDARGLQPGMLLQASVRIETRRLIEWVFDPLFSLTGKAR